MTRVHFIFRAEDLTSPKQTPESGLKRSEHFSTGEQLSVEERSEGNTSKRRGPCLCISAINLSYYLGFKAPPVSVSG